MWNWFNEKYCEKSFAQSNKKLCHHPFKNAIIRLRNLSKILPLYGVEHDAIFSKMGAVTVAFKVELTELFTMSNDEYEAFYDAWIEAIKVLPVNLVLYEQDWFTEAKCKKDFMTVRYLE